MYLREVTYLIFIESPCSLQMEKEFTSIDIIF